MPTVTPAIRAVLVSHLAAALVAAWREKNEGPATLAGHTGQKRVEARTYAQNPNTAN